MCQHSEKMSKQLGVTVYCEQVAGIVTAERPQVTVADLLQAGDVTASSFLRVPNWESIAQHPSAGLQLRTGIEDQLVTETDEQVRARLNEMLDLCPEKPQVELPVVTKAKQRQPVGVSC